MAFNSQGALSLAKNVLRSHQIARSRPFPLLWKTGHLICRSPSISGKGWNNRAWLTSNREVRRFHDGRIVQQQPKQDGDAAQAGVESNRKRKVVKASAAKSSLRRVALEAERGSRKNGTKRERGRGEPADGYELKVRQLNWIRRHNVNL